MSDIDEKAHREADQTPAETHDKVTLLGTKSPGVERIEAIAKHISFVDRIFIFFSVFLIAYAYGLDGTLRYAYQVCFQPLIVDSGKLTDFFDSQPLLQASRRIPLSLHLTPFVLSSLPPPRYVSPPTSLHLHTF